MDKATRDRALQSIPYGLYVVGAVNGEKFSTIVANWAMQVSFRPALVAIAIEDDSRMRERIEASGYFSLNMLPPGDLALARAFLKPKEFPGVSAGGKRFTRAANGSPFLQDAVASVECRVQARHVAGDHILFLGEVLDAAYRRDGKGEVLTLRETGWRYHR